MDVKGAVAGTHGHLQVCVRPSSNGLGGSQREVDLLVRGLQGHCTEIARKRLSYEGPAEKYKTFITFILSG